MIIRYDKLLYDCVQYVKMDQVPSQKISKSLLLVTPLFMIVLAVLHASSQLSYLFVLKFVNNVGGSADITFLPTLQPQVGVSGFMKESTLEGYGIESGFQQGMPKRIPPINGQQNGQDWAKIIQQLPTDTVDTVDTVDMPFRIPLVNMSQLKQWSSSHKQMIVDVSPRWLIPIQIANTNKNNKDCILLVLDINKQKQMGMFPSQSIQQMGSKQLGMEQMLMRKMGYTIGDVVSIMLKPSNMLNGLKLMGKFQDMGSDQEYKGESNNNNNINQTIQQLIPTITNYIEQYTNVSVSDEQLKQLIYYVCSSEVKVKYTLKQSISQQGMYPSAINNVITMQYTGFVQLLSGWIAHTLLTISTSQQFGIQKYVPVQYRILLPKNEYDADRISKLSKQQLSTYIEQYSLMGICRIQNRVQVYSPQSNKYYLEYARMLQSMPGTMQMIVIYPFYKQSLAIKYFFDSVIQIFQFVTCIVYFYTMALIMKQIYQEKEVEVGIWRTLGAGGLTRKKQHRQIQVQMVGNVNSININKQYRSQFQQQMSIKQKVQFIKQLAVKVGFAKYWLLTTLISTFIYYLLKQFLYYQILTRLEYQHLPQPKPNLLLLFLLITIFTSCLIYSHIHRIHTQPLSQTIKPYKRTFDMVKIRVIHIATFGITFQALLIACMLVYYGVVSYYWIPFAVLDGQQALQIVLFNSIFLFMILGAIILVGILQSKIEAMVFRLMFRCNKQMESMKMVILKNIKAKQYKNVKVAIIISIIFAFVLFFTSGIKIQMQIVQSFIERALGAQLTFQNYQKKTFETDKIQQYLGKNKQIQYSWLSRSLSRDNVSISLLSHISGEQVTPEFQVLSPSYLNSTFYTYYYPESYLSEQYKQYGQLPNGQYNGFDSIYEGEQSVGKYDPQNTITIIDPFNITIKSKIDSRYFIQSEMAPQEQVIDMVVSTELRKSLGVQVGSYYKMIVRNTAEDIDYYLRARVTHSFKAGPGFDLLGRKAFISEQQAQYIYKILGIKQEEADKKQKLFITGSVQSLKQVGSTIMSMSPQHTQMFQVDFVSKSFKLLQTYLDSYVILITAIMSTLVTIFIFLYTIGKCKDQAQMYKMLRAVGLTAKNIRIMIFCEIIIRLAIAIINGILLGIAFSIGFSLQIQEFLMIKTPPMDISIVVTIGVVLILIFAYTILKATRYLSERSVAETNKK